MAAFMRLALLLVPVLGDVLSADEASMMQTGLFGTEAGSGRLEVSAAEVKKAIRNIGDGLRSITVPGKARQMAIDALMKSVQGSEKLDPDTAQVLENISTLLNDILDEMHAERNQDQAELDAIANTTLACNEAGDAEDINLETIKNNSESNHTTCRSDEVTLFDSDAATCLILTDFLSLLSQPVCDKPLPLQANVEAWNNMLHQGASWFTTTKTNYEPKRDDCLQTTADLQAKVSACNQAQTGFENHFCEWRLHRVDKCTTLTTCYDAAVAYHNNLVATIQPISTTRVSEAGVIVHVQCLIDKLVNEGNTDHTACLPLNTAVVEARYGNTYPDIPDKDNCSTAEVDIYPGDAGWYAFAYSGLDAKTPAVTNTGVTCHSGV